MKTSKAPGEGFLGRMIYMYVIDIAGRSWPSRKRAPSSRISEDKAGQSEHSSLLNLSPGVCWKDSRAGSQNFVLICAGDTQVHSREIQVCVAQGGRWGLSGTCFWSSAVYAPVSIGIAPNWSSSMAGTQVAGPALCAIVLKIDTPLRLE